MIKKPQTILERLARLENQLQAIVEGSAARIFSSQSMAATLSKELVDVLHSGLRSTPEGALMAPNLYTIVVHPHRQSEIDQADILQELATAVQVAAESAGAKFLAPLGLQVVVDPEVPLQKIRVYAQLSPEHLSTTSSLAAELGYQDEPPPEGAFVILNGTRTISLERTVINIGRRPDNQIVIPDQRVSRQHAQMRAIHGRFVIFDLNSTGGTFVNDRRIQQHPLSPGDVISLAGVPLVYSQDNAPLEGTQQIKTA